MEESLLTHLRIRWREQHFHREAVQFVSSSSSLNVRASHFETGRHSGLTLSDSRHPAAEQLF